MFIPKNTDVRHEVEISPPRGVTIEEYFKDIQNARESLQKENCYLDSIVVDTGYDRDNELDYVMVIGYRPENEKERNKRLRKRRKEKEHKELLKRLEMDRKRRLFNELKKEFEPE